MKSLSTNECEELKEILQNPEEPIDKKQRALKSTLEAIFGPPKKKGRTEDNANREPAKFHKLFQQMLDSLPEKPETDGSRGKKIDMCMAMILLPKRRLNYYDDRGLDLFGALQGIQLAEISGERLQQLSYIIDTYDCPRLSATIGKPL